MAQSNAVFTNRPSPEPLIERIDPVAETARNANVVLQWPARQTERSAEDVQGHKRAEDLLRKLRHQPDQSENNAGLLDGDPLLLLQRPNGATSLREELPAAVTAYDTAISRVRELFPLISAKGTLDIPALEDVVATLVASLERNADALLCLAKLYESGVYVYSHAVNVCIFSAAFALDCGKSRSEAVDIGLAGLLHDAGMALLPLALLQSSRPLSATEQALVKRHPIMGCEFFAKLPEAKNLIFFAALEHHERFDGSGYPSGSSGSGISFMGHLTAICSTFDAMTSSRRHRQPITPHAALGEMFKQRNKQFHPVILENFIKMLGIYPVGSVVILRDGYCGVVTASSRHSPMRPEVTLMRDPKGHAMSPIAFDMSRERLADIGQCLSPAECGVDVYAVLGIPARN